MTQRSQGVCRFAGLRNGDDQLPRVWNRRPVTVFTGDFDRARNAGDGFQPVAGGVAGMAAGATGQDQYRVDIVEDRASFSTENTRLNSFAAAYDFERVGQCFRLLENFLLHVMTVGAQFNGRSREL